MKKKLGQIQKIFVTGGLGFIGKHLCKRLLQLGYNVVSLDDESSSADDALEFILEDTESQHKFESHIGSILDSSLVTRTIDQSVDLIFHFAAKLGVENVVANRFETLETNILGTKNILEIATQHGIPIFVASSSEVYGKSESVPFDEDSNLVFGPSTVSRWGYAASKIVDEHEALACYEESDLPVVVGRFFNIVGPGQLPESGMVIPKMISASISGKPIDVLGDGQQKRCFCHVDDCVDALCQLMLNKNQEVYGQVFNIGNPSNEISMLELARKIQAASQSSSSIKLVPYNEVFKEGSFEDMKRRVPSIEKIKKMTGWIPRRSLDQILVDSLESLKTGL